MPLTCFVTFALDGLHNWPDAPDRLSFLRHPHTHEFQFRVTFPQKESRDIEFFEFAADAETLVRGTFDGNRLRMLNFGAWSCEDIAEILASKLLRSFDFEWVMVEVSEDGRHGATVNMSRRQPQ